MMLPRSGFLGEALQTGPQAMRPLSSRPQPAQALFGKKPAKEAKGAAQKATKEAKKATGGFSLPSFGGGAKKVAKETQKSSPSFPSLPSFGGGAKKAEKEVKKAAPSLPKLGGGTKKVEKAAKKASSGGFPNPFGGGAKQAAKKAGSQAKKAAPSKSSVNKASKQTRQAGKATKGWLGGAGGAKDLDKFYGPERDLFLPDGLLDRNDVPSYLDGTLAGDYGYDPLGLGQEPAQVEKYRANELLHARWAMLAAAGIIIPEGLQANGANIKGGTWFETGAEMLGGGTLNYFAVPWAVVNNPLPLAAVTLIEVVLLGAVEKYRSDGQGPPGYSPGVGQFESDIFNGLDNLYPGGPFDPLGLADDPEVFQELQVKEIKNGRLAMVSVLAFAAQSAVTGEGPYANWARHVSDPFGYNLLTVLGNEDRLPSL